VYNLFEVTEMNGKSVRIKRPEAPRLALGATGILALILLSGCLLLPQAPTQSPPPGQMETEIAGQVAVLATGQAATQQAANGQATIAEAAQATIQAAQAATLASQPSATLQPSYTPAPTYTLLPTYTPLPSNTPASTATPVPIPPPAATSASSRGCCTLRVNNRYSKTYWIGAKMPYGGNYIKPLWYVEFYPPEPSWMRIWWCRYTTYFTEHWNDYPYSYYNEDWKDKNQWSFYKYWQQNGYLYDCNYRDIYVDQGLTEVSIP
jgi:hypothetical protein